MLFFKQYATGTVSVQSIKRALYEFERRDDDNRSVDGTKGEQNG